MIRVGDRVRLKHTWWAYDCGVVIDVNDDVLTIEPDMHSHPVDSEVKPHYYANVDLTKYLTGGGVVYPRSGLAACMYEVTRFKPKENPDQ